MMFAPKKLYIHLDYFTKNIDSSALYELNIDTPQLKVFGNGFGFESLIIQHSETIEDLNIVPGNVDETVSKCQILSM